MTGCVDKESAAALDKLTITTKHNKPHMLIDFWIVCELAHRKYIMKL
jgi:hypothetical protein